MSLVHVSVVGNLVKDPDLVSFDSGRTKACFHVAVNGFNRVTKEKFAEYYKIEVWDKLAALATQYLHKGNQVTVTGRLTMERWVDKNGQNRCTPLVHGSQLSLPQRSRSPDQTKNSADLEEFKGSPIETAEAEKLQRVCA